MSFVRQSSYRHVFGTGFKVQHQYTELRPNINAWDSDHIKANRTYFAVPWSGGGGALAVVPFEETGKKKPSLPTLSGHTSAVLDFEFSPFDESIIATASADLSVKIWQIPEGGLKETETEASVTLDGHQKKVGQVKFHPTSNNVLLSAGVDQTIRLWDIEQGKEKINIGKDEYKKNIQSISFNLNGSQFATTSKDKKLRVVDPRAAGQEFVSVTDGHVGTKGSRVVWLKKLDKIFTVGFTKMAEREMMLWDPRDMTKPIINQQIDVSAGLFIPLYDEDTSIMYLAGKGDTVIHYYEINEQEPFIHHISGYASSEAQRGCTMLPKTAMDTSVCETTRLLKLTSTKVIPVMFQVPRKADTYQADIYPDTFAPEPTQSSEDFFEGKDAEPKMTSMDPSKSDFKSFKPSQFKPKVQKKAPKTDLPKKTSDPTKLNKQNEELRKRVEELEKEVFALKQELKEAKSSEEQPQEEQPQEEQPQE